MSRLSKGVTNANIVTDVVYNKWHETELERWLSDHSIPYPTPADRKDLESLVKSNWQQKVVTPYSDWELPQLQSYLSAKGYDAKKASAANKDSLVNQVKSYWTESADSASSSYSSVKDWIFDRFSFLLSPCCTHFITDKHHAAGPTLSSRLFSTEMASPLLNLVSVTPC